MSSQGYGFSSSHVWMWELDHKESWVQKNWCFWTMVLEKTLDNPLESKEIKPVNCKGKQSWIFTGRTDAESETLILWPPDVKDWLCGKDSDPGKDWRQEEKRMTGDEMVVWHHQIHGHGFGWTLGVDDGQGGLAYCCSWGHKESDTTEQLNWTELGVSDGQENLMCCSPWGRKELDTAEWLNWTDFISIFFHHYFLQAKFFQWVNISSYSDGGNVLITKSRPTLLWPRGL